MNSVIRQRMLRVACIAFLLAAAAAAQSHYVVIAPVANMYRAPSVDAEVVSQAIFSNEVVALETHRRWVKVRSSDDYTGWIRRIDLRRASADEDHHASRSAAVSALFASLYREPNVETHAPIITVPYESALEITSDLTNEDGRWFTVRLPDGRNAFVQAGDVNLEAKLLSIDEAIALGRRFLGIPYRWGGKSSFGFDCSGFTQMLMRSRGVNMPRDARPQSKWDGTAPVERADLQPGDLLYFGRSADKVNHTGMYIGNGEFIHATRNRHPAVQISRLDDLPWTRAFVAARRAK